ERLDEVERFLASLSASRETSPSPVPTGDWHHAPLHRISEEGTYLVTAATLAKAHVFRGAERLDYLLNELQSQLKEAGWHLEAWAVFSNHYHFVAHAPPSAADAASLSPMLKTLHTKTGGWVNKLDATPERQVWFNFRETRLTYQRSYFARLNYTHQNPVKHGLVPVAN